MVGLCFPDFGFLQLSTVSSLTRTVLSNHFKHVFQNTLAKRNPFVLGFFM